MTTQTIYKAKDGKRFDTAEDCDRYERLPQRIEQALKTNPWIPTTQELAPEGVEVLTKIDDAKGSRNRTTLKHANNLWWAPDRSMYVYYRPTHWMRLPN